MFGKKAAAEQHASKEDKGKPPASESKSHGEKPRDDGKVTADKVDPAKEESNTEAEPEKSSWASWANSALDSVDVLSLVQNADIMGEDNKVDLGNKDGADKQDGQDGSQPVDKNVLAEAQKQGTGAIDKMDIPDDKKQLMQALAASQNATGLLAKANALKDKAAKCLNPEERQRMLQESYDKEVEAHGQSKWAKRMQSGVWQGGVGGAGVGGGVGMGLGTVVGTVTGTLVGGVASIPTTALGGLVGIGVGGIHGPFIKLDQRKAKEVAEREKSKGKSDKEIEEAVKKEAVVEEVNEEEGDKTEPESPHESRSDSAADPAEGHEKQQSDVPNEQPSQPTNGKPERTGPRRKPRKIEIRSGGNGTLASS